MIINIYAIHFISTIDEAGKQLKTTSYKYKINFILVYSCLVHYK